MEDLNKIDKKEELENERIEQMFNEVGIKKSSEMLSEKEKQERIESAIALIGISGADYVFKGDRIKILNLLNFDRSLIKNQDIQKAVKNAIEVCVKHYWYNEAAQMAEDFGLPKPESVEGKKRYSAEDMIKVSESREASDAELLKGGAKYKTDKTGNKNLELTEAQMVEMREMNNKNEIIGSIKRLGGGALRYFSPKVQNDKDIVSEAVKQDGASLGWASEEFRNDEDIVLEAVKQDEFSISYASKRLKNDEGFILKAVEENPKVLAYLPDFQDNKQVVLEAVKRDGTVLLYASLVLKNDKEVVLEAVKQNSEALAYASENLKKDDDVKEAAGIK